MPGVPVLLGPVSMGLSAKSGGVAAASSQQRLGPAWLPGHVGVRAGLQCIPFFYPLFSDVVMEAASTQPGAWWHPPEHGSLSLLPLARGSCSDVPTRQQWERSQELALSRWEACGQLTPALHLLGQL